MIGHQTVGINCDGEFFSISAKPLQVRLIVALVPKGLLSLVATNDDVVKQTGRKYARTTSHAAPFHERSKIVKNRILLKKSYSKKQEKKFRSQMLYNARSELG